jgi:hypothetical protein
MAYSLTEMPKQEMVDILRGFDALDAASAARSAWDAFTLGSDDQIGLLETSDDEDIVSWDQFPRKILAKAIREAEIIFKDANKATEEPEDEDVELASEDEDIELTDSEDIDITEDAETGEELDLEIDTEDLVDAGEEPEEDTTEEGFDTDFTSRIEGALQGKDVTLKQDDFDIEDLTIDIESAIGDELEDEMEDESEGFEDEGEESEIELEDEDEDEDEEYEEEGKY